MLIRHSVPDIRRDVPAAEWRLSDVGAARAAAFARQVDPGSATTIFTSEEPKAVETAHALAAAWGLPVEAFTGLQEHHRPAAQMLSRHQFDDRLRQLFAHPRELIFGTETAEQARRRFTLALMRLVARSANDVIAVSHGTVMSLFVAEATGIEPFTLWKSLEMPVAITITLPDLSVAEIIRFVGS